MTKPTRQQVLDLIDAIAREWDGCEYEDAMVPDIGEAIRQAARPRINALFLELSTLGVKGMPTMDDPARPAMSMFATAADYNAAMDEWLRSHGVPGRDADTNRHQPPMPDGADR
jgi:hypothetical protein